MVPWYKEYNVEQGLNLFPDDQIPVGLDFDEYLKTNQPKHALESYEEQIQDYLAQHHPGETLETIAYKESLIPFSLSILSPSIPKIIKQNLSYAIQTFTEVPDEDRSKITLNIIKKDNDDDQGNDQSLLSYTVTLTELAGNRFCIDSVNTSGVWKPVFKLNGVIKKGGEATNPGLSSSEQFYLSFTRSDYPSERVDFPSKDAGTFIQFDLDPIAASEKTIFRLKEELAGLDPSLMDNQTTREKFLGRMGKILNETHLLRRYENLSRIDKLFYKRSAWGSTPMIVYTNPNSINWDKESKFGFHPQWGMDVRRVSYSGYKRFDKHLGWKDWNSPAWSMARSFFGYAGSYNEGMVFEDWQDTPGGNTIRGLMLAYEDPDIPVEELDSDDIPMLEALKTDAGNVSNALSVGTLNYWIDLLSHGHTILAPLRKINFGGGATGKVYRVLGPTDGHNGYWFGMDRGGGSAPNTTPPTNVGSATNIQNTDTTISPPAQNSVTDTHTSDGITDAPENGKFAAFISTLGDPVNMAKGEFYTEEYPDIVIPSRGFDLSVVRGYRSQLIYNGPFGYGWTWNHAERIVPQENGDILYYDKSVAPQILTHNGDNTYQPAPGITYSVVKENSEYKIIFRDKTQFVFNSDGFLTTKQDSYGNVLLFDYDTAHPERLVMITDSIGRSLEFFYNQTNDKVERVQDFTGRFCTYTYNGDDLVSFTDLENNTTTFEYLDNQSNDQNNHNLSKYTLPNGDYLEIGYYENDQVSFHRNKKGETFNFFFSRLNRYAETWNEEGYYRKVFFNENNDETRVLNEDGTISQKEYDQNHNLIKETDANGNITTYAYGPDPTKRLIASTTNSLDQSTTYLYEDSDCPHKPSRIIDPKGQIKEFSYYPSSKLKTQTIGVGYAYDTDQQLVVSAGAPGFTTTYLYDTHGNLTKVTDPEGNFITQTFDGNSLNPLSVSDKNTYTTDVTYYQAGEGQPIGLVKAKILVSPLHGEGISTTYQYNNYNQQTVITDALSGQTLQEYNQNRQPTVLTRPTGTQVTKTYHVARDIVSGAQVKEIIDPMNNSAIFKYDKLGNPILQTDPNGGKTNFYYDSLSRLVSKTDAMGNTEYFKYDGNGKVIAQTDKRGGTTHFDYDALGNLIRMTDPLGNSIVYTYDVNNNKETITDFNQIVVKFVYDALDRVVTKTIGFGESDARTFGYRYDIFNRIVKEIRPEGDYTTFQYDPAGNLTLKVNYDKDGQEVRREKTLYYADARNLVQSIIIDSGKDGLEQGTYYEYDKLGRKIAQWDEVGNQITYEHDSMGNLFSTTTPLGITVNRYDSANHLVATINPNAEETNFDYDPNGNLVWTRDPNKNESQIFYDACNQKIGTLDAMGNVVTYAYDENSNLISVSDKKSQTTFYEYDDANRKVLMTRPMGQETRYCYDNGGRLSEIINGLGHKTSYTYNNLDKPVQVAYYNASTPIKIVTMSYNANGNLTGYNDTVTSANYTYDGLGRKLSTTVDFGPFTKSFSNSYPSYWTQTFTGPDNLTTTYEFDASMRLTSATHSTAGTVQHQNYLWYLPQKRITPATTTEHMYDPNGRVSLIKGQNNSNVTLLNRQYAYDANGDLYQLTTEHGDYLYGYDELARLTSVTAPQGLDSETYTYDNTGNRLTSLVTTSDWQYNKNNELTENGATSYTYDDAGNITAKTGDNPLEFLYDETNRMTEVRDSDGVTKATYCYDPFGNRLWKEVDSTRTYFLHSDQGLIAEYDGTGQEISAYGYLPGTANSVAPLYMKTGGVFYWYQRDHLGTPQQLVDETGTIVWEARYSGFGKASMEVETITSNFRLPGQYFDTETGLHYNRNRYYDPDTGRYLRTDPLGLDGGLNLYLYALNNPLRYTDPDGLMVRKHQGKIFAVGKIVGGSVVVVFGLATVPETGPVGAAVFVIGASTVADGFASLIAESLGGDTGAVPALPILLVWDIAKGVIELGEIVE